MCVRGLEHSCQEQIYYDRTQVKHTTHTQTHTDAHTHTHTHTHTQPTCRVVLSIFKIQCCSLADSSLSFGINASCRRSNRGSSVLIGCTNGTLSSASFLNLTYNRQGRAKGMGLGMAIDCNVPLHLYVRIMYKV